MRSGAKADADPVRPWRIGRPQGHAEALDRAENVVRELAVDRWPPCHLIRLIGQVGNRDDVILFAQPNAAGSPR